MRIILQIWFYESHNIKEPFYWRYISAPLSVGTNIVPFEANDVFGWEHDDIVVDGHLFNCENNTLFVQARYTQNCEFPDGFHELMTEAGFGTQANGGWGDADE